MIRRKREAEDKKQGDYSKVKHMNITRCGTVATLVGMLLFAAAAEKRATASERETGDKSPCQAIRVITYNVQFLPGLAAAANKRKDTKYRAVTLGKKLAEYDIVALNEVFHLVPRKLLLDELKKAWGEKFQVVVSPKPDDHRFNGGLAIASRLPFVETHAMIYSVASSPKVYGIRADGFAAKGVLHARIRRSPDAAPTDYIDVFTTHMEARDDDIRLLQYPEIARFIKKYSDSKRRAIIMGDFNTRGNPEYQADPGAPYHLLLRELASARPGGKLVDLWPSLNSGNGGTSEQTTDDGGRRIDYIFTLEPLGAPPALEPLSCRVNQYRDPKVVALSDHSAVEAEFKWCPRPKSD